MLRHILLFNISVFSVIQITLKYVVVWAFFYKYEIVVS